MIRSGCLGYIARQLRGNNPQAVTGAFEGIAEALQRQVLAAGENVVEHVFGKSAGFAKRATRGEMVEETGLRAGRDNWEAGSAPGKCQAEHQILGNLTNRSLHDLRTLHAAGIVKLRHRRHPEIVESAPVGLRACRRSSRPRSRLSSLSKPSSVMGLPSRSRYTLTPFIIFPFHKLNLSGYAQVYALLAKNAASLTQEQAQLPDSTG